MKPTQERLKELLSYDPQTGDFFWKVDRSNVKAGTPAGCLTGHGYVRISLGNKDYRAHHLAWLYMTGEWPNGPLDHQDLNKKNNSWVNLRLATPTQNNANTRITSANKSGLKGVSFHSAGAKHGKPWQAHIQKDRKAIHLGLFVTKEEAHAAYCEAAQKIFGEFARAA